MAEKLTIEQQAKREVAKQSLIARLCSAKTGIPMTDTRKLTLAVMKEFHNTEILAQIEYRRNEIIELESKLI